MSCPAVADGATGEDYCEQPPVAADQIACLSSSCCFWDARAWACKSAIARAECPDSGAVAAPAAELAAGCMVHQTCSTALHAGLARLSPADGDHWPLGRSAVLDYQLGVGALAAVPRLTLFETDNCTGPPLAQASAEVVRWFEAAAAAAAAAYMHALLAPHYSAWNASNHSARWEPAQAAALRGLLALDVALPYAAFEADAGLCWPAALVEASRPGLLAYLQERAAEHPAEVAAELRVLRAAGRGVIRAPPSIFHQR